MLGPEYDSESKGLLDELLAVPSLESGGGGSLQRISAKRVAGRGPEAKTSKGFGKDMGMELGSLSGGKVEGPKAGVGSDMLELARQYKLKAKRAEDAARGLMRGTLGEPTLEQPTLLRGPLVKRRFQKGGEVSAKSQLDQFPTPAAPRVGLAPLEEDYSAYAHAISRMTPEEQAYIDEKSRLVQSVRGGAPAFRPRMEGAAYGAKIGPYGTVFLDPRSDDVKRSLAHEMTHAVDDSLESLYRHALKNPDTPLAKQFAALYKSLGEHTRPADAKRLSPAWYKSMQDYSDAEDAKWGRYRTNQKELGAWGAGIMFSPKNLPETLPGGTKPMRGGLHVDPTMTTQFEILKEFGAKYADELMRRSAHEMYVPEFVAPPQAAPVAPAKPAPAKKPSSKDRPIKRAEGGDVSRETSESRSYLDELDARDDPIRSGRPLQSRTRRKATPEQNEALNRAALQGVANMPYNLVGAPVDLLNMLLTPTGLGSEKPVMGSDWIKQKMTDLGVRPEPPTDPTQRAVYSAADFASNFVNPAAPVRAMAKGAEKTGEAARRLAEDFQRYNQALGPAGASHVIKPKGGSWEQASVDRELNSIKRVDRYGLQSPEQTAKALGISVDEARKLWDPGDLALNTWIDRNLGNYIKRELASPKDPLRELAESGVLSARLAPFERAAAEDISNYPWLLKERPASGFPTEGMARGPDAKVWENMADTLLITMNAGNLPENILARQPGLRNLPPDEPVYKLRETAMYDIGFDHVVDVLRGDIQAGRLDPKRLDNLSVEQAVRRTDQFDKMMAKRQQQARIKAASDLPVVKQYDEGYRWLELKPKLADDWKPPENVEIVQITPDAQVWAILDKNTNTYLYAGFRSPSAALERLKDIMLIRRTEEVLKQEGDVMGHCIGSYCSDVLAGKSQNFSLRDAEGEQHVTIEVKPALGYTQSEAAAAAQAEGLRGQEFANRVADLMEGAGVPPRIAQIKGKGNAKPKGEYLPFVQDFIKSSNWSEVKDLRNAGMVQVTEGQRLPGFSKTIPPGFYTLDELRQMAVENEMPQEILDTWMSKLGDQLKRGFAQGGLVNASTARAQLDRLMAA